jgi:hypothetical protein
MRTSVAALSAILAAVNVLASPFPHARVPAFAYSSPKVRALQRTPYARAQVLNLSVHTHAGLSRTRRRVLARDRPHLFPARLSRLRDFGHPLGRRPRLLRLGPLALSQ